MSSAIGVFLKKDNSDNAIDSVDKIDLVAYNGNNDTADSVYKDNFDVVFMIDEINYSNYG